MHSRQLDFSVLLGKTLTSISGAKPNEDVIDFKCSDGTRYQLFHCQDCCESVQVEEVIGDVDDLIGSPLLMAEEVSNSDQDKPSEWCDSWTWTFYKLATIKGSVTIRWLGTSNGYYSERVSFAQVA